MQLPSRLWFVRLPLNPPNRRMRDPHVRWCGRGEWATTPPMPIGAHFAAKLHAEEDNLLSRPKIRSRHKE
jgi:hypothetical protein